MGSVPSFVEILFRWNGFADVLEGLRDDRAAISPWTHKAAMSRLELDRDVVPDAA